MLSKAYSHPGSGPLLTVQYSHDQLGRREAFRRTDAQGIQTRTYTYRAHGELIRTDISTVGAGPVPNRSIDYAFDNNYNLTSNDNNGYSVNSAGQLTGGNGFSQIHDDAGSVATLARPDSRTTFKYDFRDQLLSAENEDHSISYDYDGDNIRTRKTVDGQVTNYLTLSGQVLKEYDGNGNAGNAYLPGVAWRRNNDAGDWNYYLTDGLGSVLAITDNGGNEVARYDYSDYGVLQSSDGPLAEENQFRYTGEQFDPETGFYYLRNRYYQPEFGRFLQRDPIRYAGGSNMYTYCGGDPINSSDPSGLRTDDELGFQADQRAKPRPQGPRRQPWLAHPAGYHLTRAQISSVSGSGHAASGGLFSPEFVGDVVVTEATLGLGGRILAGAGRAADSGAGIGGEAISQEEFNATKSALAEMGIEIEHSAGLGRNGSFTALGVGRAVIDFGEKLPSSYVFYHELGHAQHFLELGFKGYVGAKKAVRENYVLGFLKGLVNADEMSHATNYARGYR